MSTRQQRQKFIRYFRDKTGKTEIDMHEVALLAKQMKWDMPKPPTDVELLAKRFAEDAQAEKEIDDETGRPYRVYHAIPVGGQMNLFVYVDIDEAKRPQMLKSAVHRREMMVSDGLNLTNDLDHWNRKNPKSEPITLPMDLTLDIAIRKAADEDGEEEAA